MKNAGAENAAIQDNIETSVSRLAFGAIRATNGSAAIEEMDMTRLSELTKNKIAEVLDATCFTQHIYTVKCDDENNPMVTIASSAGPGYQFVINSADDGNTFTTNECPGIHSDAAETFQRSDFELCIAAIVEWAKRIVDRETDWIMDEFGGVADRNPSIPTKQGAKNH